MPRTVARLSILSTAALSLLLLLPLSVRFFASRERQDDIASFGKESEGSIDQQRLLKGHDDYDMPSRESAAETPFARTRSTETRENIRTLLFQRND